MIAQSLQLLFKQFFQAGERRKNLVDTSESMALSAPGRPASEARGFWLAAANALLFVNPSKLLSTCCLLRLISVYGQRLEMFF